jgi:hypothetical protein
VIRRDALLATACGLMLGLPFWISPFVPLVDLPQHLAVASVIRHHGEPGWAFDRYYEVEWGALTPYWSYYLVLDALSQVMSLDAASRVVLGLYALAVPWTGLALCGAFGAPRWTGLLFAPLALNSNLYFGFVAYVAGVLLALVLLAEYRRLQDRPTVARAAAVALLSCALFFTHVQPFAFLLAAALLLTLVSPSPGPARRRLAPLLAFAPAVLALFLPWAYREFAGPRRDGGEYNFGTLGNLHARYDPARQKILDLPSAVSGSYADGSDTVIFAAWAGLVASLIAASGRRGATGHSWLGVRLALIALLAYFALPLSIQGQWNIAPRFAWLAALLIVPAIGDPGPRLTRVGIIGAVALTTAAALLAAHQHRRFGQESAAFAGVLAAVPPGQRVLSLSYDPRSRVFTQWPYLHFVQYVVAFRGGAAGWSLAKSPPFPIRHPDAAALPTLHPFIPEDFRYGRHGYAYDYFIARAGPGADRIFAAAPVRPELVFEGGGWRVWRNRLADPPR